MFTGRHMPAFEMGNAGADSGLPSSEMELLLLLLMCPETAEELDTMLMEDDRRTLSSPDGNGVAGIASVLKRLEAFGLFSGESKPDIGGSPTEVWSLTEQGRLIARHEAAKQ